MARHGLIRGFFIAQVEPAPSAFPNDRFLRLLFSPDGKLTAWKRLVKLSFLFIFALSIQSVWVFNIPE
jgi:hypothetical protein